MPATAKLTAQDILAELKPLGSDAYRQILLKHGAKDPIYGVKIEHLKKIQKRIKTDYQLALDLFDTGVYDAMYLAGLIADDARMTKKDLRHWVETAKSPSICTTPSPGSPRAANTAARSPSNGSTPRPKTSPPPAGIRSPASSPRRTMPTSTSTSSSSSSTASRRRSTTNPTTSATR